MSPLDKTNHAQYREAQERALRRVCHDIIDTHDNSPPILTVLYQNGFETLRDLILIAWDVIDDLVYSPTEGEPPTHFSNYVHQYYRLKWFIKWNLHLIACDKGYLHSNLDLWNALNREDFDKFIISSGGKVENAIITRSALGLGCVYHIAYLNARENNSSKEDNTSKSPLARRTIVEEQAAAPPVIMVPTTAHIDKGRFNKGYVDAEVDNISTSVTETIFTDHVE